VLFLVIVSLVCTVKRLAWKVVSEMPSNVSSVVIAHAFTFNAL